MASARSTGWAAADVEKVTRAGQTCLMVASAAGHLEPVKHLVDVVGAKMETKDRHGTTSLDYAKQFKHKGVYRFLLARTACPAATASGAFAVSR